MSKSRELFKLEIIAGNEPMANDAFFKWLNDQPGKQNRFMDSVVRYLESVGCDLKKHKIEPEQYDRLCHIFNHYCHMWRPIPEPMDFDDLFKSEASDRGYWVMGRLGRYWPKPFLKNVLENLGLIYSLGPDNFYFEIVNGDLFIKYQFIIGSRRIVTIK